MDRQNPKPGWRVVEFGQVVKLNKERSKDPLSEGLVRYIGLEHLQPGDLRVRSWGNVADGTTFTNRFRPGQVLFGKRRAYQRKVAVADFDGVCSGDIYVLETKDPDVVLPELLPFICQTESFFEHAVGTSAGSLSPRTNWKSLAGYKFALPPLEEQRRVTALLGAARSTFELTQDAGQALWTARIAMYHQTTRHDDVYNGDSGNVALPTGWKQIPVAEAVDIQNNLRKPLSKAVRSSMQGDYPYFGPTGQLDSIDEYRFDGRRALIGEDGDHFLKWSTWSMTQLVDGRFNVNNHAHVIKGTPECSTEWFFHFFRHRDVREWLTKQGAGRLKLKKTTLEQIPILLPPPLEQERLVKLFDEIDRACLGLEQRATMSRQLLAQILGHVLNGDGNVQ